VLEADLLRSEAKIEALAHPDPNATFSYRRGPQGEVLAEEKDEIPVDKEEGQKRWRWEMEMRFLRGGDDDFEYKDVDESEEYDDRGEEEREAEEKYFAEEKPEWVTEDDQKATSLQGETGILDY
jgi:hypothetical protein